MFFRNKIFANKNRDWYSKYKLGHQCFFLSAISAIINDYKLIRGKYEYQPSKYTWHFWNKNNEGEIIDQTIGQYNFGGKYKEVEEVDVFQNINHVLKNPAWKEIEPNIRNDVLEKLGMFVPEETPDEDYSEEYYRIKREQTPKPPPPKKKKKEPKKEKQLQHEITFDPKEVNTLAQNIEYGRYQDGVNYYLNGFGKKYNFKSDEFRRIKEQYFAVKIKNKGGEKGALVNRLKAIVFKEIIKKQEVWYNKKKQEWEKYIKN